MSLSITVEIKSVYGEQKIYPVCELAKIFASMVGQKTLTLGNIDHIKSLGFEVLVKQSQPNKL